LGELAGEAADEMLLAGAQEVKEAWVSAAFEAGHVKTGDMIRSIGYPRKPKTINDIKSIDIYPQGKDRNGMGNAQKAFVLHYGTSKIVGSRFVDVADKRSAPRVEKVMTEIWEKKLKQKGLVDK